MAFLAAFVFFVVPTQARASSPKPIRLDVEASCASASDVFRRIASRTASVTLAEGDEPAELVTVQVHSENGKVAGDFSIDHGEARERSVRHVEGDSCEEVIDVLALGVALAYDAEAEAEAEAEARSELTAVSAPPAVVVPAQRRTRPEPPHGWRWRVGGYAALSTMSPSPFGAELAAEVLHERPPLPSLRLALTAQHATFDSGNLSASFWWVYATPSVCPVHLRVSALEVGPCAGIALGAFSAVPHGLANGRSFLRPWVAPNAALTANVWLGPHVAIGARAALDIALVRGEYTFGSLTAYEAPLVSTSFALGVAFAVDRRAPGP